MTLKTYCYTVVPRHCHSRLACLLRHTGPTGWIWPHPGPGSRPCSLLEHNNTCWLNISTNKKNCSIYRGRLLRLEVPDGVAYQTDNTINSEAALTTCKQPACAATGWRRRKPHRACKTRRLSRLNLKSPPIKGATLPSDHVIHTQKRIFKNLYLVFLVSHN